MKLIKLIFVIFYSLPYYIAKRFIKIKGISITKVNTLKLLPLAKI